MTDLPGILRMDYEAFIFPAFYVLAMFTAAIQPKALGLCIVFTVAMSAVYPNVEQASLLTLMFVPALVIASFRE